MRRDISTEEMRQIQLRLMDCIDDFCTREGITYSLSGGTMLGAVRHQGFIPWDDDIDLMMPRPDYDRFIKTFPGQYPDTLLENYYTDPDYPCAFTKVSDPRTTLVARNNRLTRFGVYVDIFSVEGTPEDEADVPAYIEKFFGLQKDLHKRAPIHRYTTSPLVWLKVWIRRRFYPKASETIRRIDELRDSIPYESAKFVGSIAGGTRRQFHFPAEMFRHYVRLPFEGRMLNCIEDTDSYLRTMYGDYMQLPPEKDRRMPHMHGAWIEE